MKKTSLIFCSILSALIIAFCFCKYLSYKNSSETAELSQSQLELLKRLENESNIISLITEFDGVTGALVTLSNPHEESYYSASIIIEHDIENEIEIVIDEIVSLILQEYPEIHEEKIQVSDSKGKTLYPRLKN